MTEDDLTPIAIERKLRSLVNDLTRAQAALAEARDEEVKAKHEYLGAYRAKLLSADCPKVTRGGYTTAERDAWVDQQVANQQIKFDVAEAKRKAAEDHLRTLRDQAIIVATLAKSVGQAYSLAGVND